MGDAVVRVQSQLQALARDNWAALEAKHARNLSWLRAELESVSRSLGVHAAVDVKRPAPAPFVRCALEQGGNLKGRAC